MTAVLAFPTNLQSTFPFIFTPCLVLLFLLVVCCKDLSYKEYLAVNFSRPDLGLQILLYLSFAGIQWNW